MTINHQEWYNLITMPYVSFSQVPNWLGWYSPNCENKPGTIKRHLGVSRPIFHPTPFIHEQEVIFLLGPIFTSVPAWTGLEFLLSFFSLLILTWSFPNQSVLVPMTANIHQKKSCHSNTTPRSLAIAAGMGIWIGGFTTSYYYYQNLPLKKKFIFY